jgi:hypothetical protein
MEAYTMETGSLVNSTALAYKLGNQALNLKESFKMEKDMAKQQ